MNKYSKNEILSIVRSMTLAGRAFRAKFTGVCCITGIHFYAGEQIRQMPEGGPMAGKWFRNDTMSIFQLRSGNDNEMRFCPTNGFDADMAWAMLERGQSVTLYNDNGTPTVWIKDSFGIHKRGRGVHGVSKAQFKSRTRGQIIMSVPDVTRTVTV